AEGRVARQHGHRRLGVQALDELLGADVLDGGAAAVSGEEAAAGEVGHFDAHARILNGVRFTSEVNLTPFLCSHPSGCRDIVARSPPPDRPCPASASSSIRPRMRTSAPSWTAP